MRVVSVDLPLGVACLKLDDVELLHRGYPVMLTPELPHGGS
jgi:hypothetical protein